jgi:hypothetical protein
VIHCQRAMGNPRSTTHEISGGAMPAVAGDD